MVQTLLQVIEEDITQYDMILGIPWIRDMQCVLSIYHNYLKCIHEGVVHYVPGDEIPYSHCNVTHVPNDVALPSTYFFIAYIPTNELLVVDVFKNNLAS